MSASPAPDGTPLCPGCLASVDALRYYCARCGWDTGQFTSYMPFVNIRWQADAHGRMWNRLWYDSTPALAAKIGLFVLVVLTAPVMLVGLPFVWRESRRRMAANERGEH